LQPYASVSFCTPLSRRFEMRSTVLNWLPFVSVLLIANTCLGQAPPVSPTFQNAQITYTGVPKVGIVTAANASVSIKSNDTVGHMYTVSL
jgi:hypothetical protein